jgi:hypothetical protein
MVDRTLPAWLRLVLLFTSLLQAMLGIAQLLNPTAINGLWPWVPTPITARLLGTLAAVIGLAAVLDLRGARA